MTQEQKPLPGAGRELDRLVAAKMGYEWLGFTGAYGEDIGRWVKSGTKESAYDGMWRHETGRAQPQYSTDIGAAWEIVRHMRSRGYTFHIYEDDRPGHGNYWVAGFNTRDITKACGGSQHRGETAPLAICLSFLQLPDEAVKE